MWHQEKHRETLPVVAGGDHPNVCKEGKTFINKPWISILSIQLQYGAPLLNSSSSYLEIVSWAKL